MARVTVEDCVEEIPNRFELVLIAAQRARDVAAGAVITIERDNDKNPVVALREIAERKLDLENLHTAIVRGLQKTAEPDEPEEEIVELMTAEQSYLPAKTAELEDADGWTVEGEAGSEVGEDEDDAEDELVAPSEDELSGEK